MTIGFWPAQGERVEVSGSGEAAPVATGSPTRLFVYGTLQRGGENGLRMRGATFLGPAVTREGYGLVRMGDYPALVPAASGTVTGEVFLVPEALLAELDEFEGCPHLYRRAEIELTAGGSAHAYLLGRAPAGEVEWIPRGVWLPEGQGGGHARGS